jgi:hypothetical protein
MKLIISALALTLIASHALAGIMGNGSHATGTAAANTGIHINQASAGPSKKQQGVVAQGFFDLANYFHFLAVAYHSLAAYELTLGNSSVATTFLNQANTFQDDYGTQLQNALTAESKGQ